MAAIIQKRLVSFLIWQTIQSSLVFILTKSFILSPLSPPSLSINTLLTFTLSLLSFAISNLLFSLSLHYISSPSFRSPATPLHLILALIRFVFTSSPPSDPDFTRRAWVSLSIFLFLFTSVIFAPLGILSLAATTSSASFHSLIVAFASRSFLIGFLYAVFSLFQRRFLLFFPILQRPPFFSYKMGLPSGFRQALKLSVVFFLFSGIVGLIMPYQHKEQVTGGFLAEQFIFYVGTFAVILCWELTFNLHQVLHTKRFMFAPPKGSVAFETNPCDPLLTTLEESYPRSLLQYLAYLDLNMVCGSNSDPWRRAAFFEETGETYKRVVTVCLRPLDQLAGKIAAGLSSSADINKLSHQLSSPADIHQSSDILDSFGDFQLYAWCAQAVASLEVCSHKEDRFGVAQLSGSHGTVLSTLLACLLAVETFMGKKISLQSPNHMLGPAGIKWATNSTARREIASAMSKKRGSPSHLKSYALADVLKTSIYSIVAEFYEEMLASAKSGLLEKEWVSSSKPVYGSVEFLVQKLHFFLNFQAS